MIFLGGDFSKKDFSITFHLAYTPWISTSGRHFKNQKNIFLSHWTFHVTDYKSCESSPNVPLKYKWVGRSQENIATVKPWSIGFRGADLSSSTVKNPCMTFDFSKT